MGNPRIKTFEEGYLVKFDYLDKTAEFWVSSREETVFVKVEHGVNEKGNHDKAEEIIKKKYHKVEIKSVTYI